VHLAQRLGERLESQVEVRVHRVSLYALTGTIGVPPNQRLQPAGARGFRVGWLEREAEVVQVLCGWRGVARR